jgi:hypothetical protein
VIDRALESQKIIDEYTQKTETFGQKVRKTDSKPLSLLLQDNYESYLERKPPSNNVLSHDFQHDGQLNARDIILTNFNLKFLQETELAEVFKHATQLDIPTLARIDAFLSTPKFVKCLTDISQILTQLMQDSKQQRQPISKAAMKDRLLAYLKQVN